MKKPIEILTAWKNVVVGDEQIKKLAEERMAVCLACPHKASMFGVDVCNICHCPLVGKTHSPVNSCPEKKWNR